MYTLTVWIGGVELAAEFETVDEAIEAGQRIAAQLRGSAVDWESEVGS